MSQTTPNEKNLKTLGESELSKLLLSIASRHPVEKRRLRYVLCHKYNPYGLEAELKKQLEKLSKKIKLEKIPALLDEIELQNEMVPALHSMDPYLALGHRFNLADTLYKLTLMIPYEKQYKKTLKHTKSLLKTLLGQQKELISSQSLDSHWFAQHFLALTHHGGGFFSFLEEIAPTLGKERLEELRQQAKDLYTTEYKGQRKDGDRKESYKKLSFLMKVIPLLQGDLKSFLKKEIQNLKNKDPKLSYPAYLAKLADDFMDEKMIRSAEACLFSIPIPEAKEEKDSPWYKAYDGLLHLQGKEEEAKEFRWDYFQQNKNAFSARFYLEPWSPLPYSPPSARYKKEATHLQQDLIHNHDPAQAFTIGLELLHEPGFKSFLDEWTLFHSHNPDKIAQIPFELCFKDDDYYYDSIIDSTTLPITILLASREMLRRYWILPKKNKKINKKISALTNTAESTYYYYFPHHTASTEHILDHHDFMSALKKGKKNPHQKPPPRPNTPKSQASQPRL